MLLQSFGELIHWICTKILSAYHWFPLFQLQMVHCLIPAFHCRFLPLRCVRRHPWFVLWLVLNNSECSRIFPDLSISGASLPSHQDLLEYGAEITELMQIILRLRFKRNENGKNGTMSK